MSEPSSNATAGSPIVSIQTLGSLDAVAGHRSWGVLIKPDLVVTPAPLDWLSELGPLFEVLTGSARSFGPGLVERLRPARVEVFGLETAPEGAVAIITMTHESRQHPYDGVIESDAFGPAFVEDPDVWTALENGGAVPLGIRELPVEAVLSAVAGWETELRNRLINNSLVEEPEFTGQIWCKLTRKCMNPSPWW